MHIVKTLSDQSLKPTVGRLFGLALTALAGAVASATFASADPNSHATALNGRSPYGVELHEPMAFNTTPITDFKPDYSNVRDDAAAVSVNTDKSETATASKEENFKIDVIGARFKVTDASGRVLPQAELVGATFNAAIGISGPLQLRVRSVQQDPSDHSGEIFLYELMAQDSETGAWRNICGPGPNGLSAAFPVQGVHESIEPSGSYALTCTSGSVGKCVRLGYKPWAEKNGRALRDYHAACVRMFRADYCGNGQSHTRDGTIINLYDMIGIQSPDSEPESFEASWGPDGAVCVRKTRLADLMTLPDLQKICPNRLRGRIGAACAEERATQNPKALLFNRS